MSISNRSIIFQQKEFKGSRLRCLLLTSQSGTKVAGFLSSLVAPHATVSPEHRWAPRGFLHPDEAKLGEVGDHEFLSEADRDKIAAWWLAKSGSANTPNWDLLSECSVGNRRGLILLEAKAHESELADEPSSATDTANVAKIKRALGEATAAWNALSPGFALSFDHHYQLSNRFAFAWKLAELGIPTVLVYLGFTNANEMADHSKTFKGNNQWTQCVLARTAGIIPEAVWGKTLDVGGTPLTALICSAHVRVELD